MAVRGRAWPCVAVRGRVTKPLRSVGVRLVRVHNITWWYTYVILGGSLEKLVHLHAAPRACGTQAHEAVKRLPPSTAAREPPRCQPSQPIWLGPPGTSPSPPQPQPPPRTCGLHSLTFLNSCGRRIMYRWAGVGAGAVGSSFRANGQPPSRLAAGARHRAPLSLTSSCG